MEDHRPKYASKSELDQVVRRISSTEISIKAVNGELERIRAAVSLAIAEALETAKKQAAAAIAPVAADAAESRKILEIQEIREEAKAEAEKEAAARQAILDTRFDYMLGQRRHVAEITGKHSALVLDEAEVKDKRWQGWATIASTVLAFIVGAGGFQWFRQLWK